MFCSAAKPAAPARRNSAFEARRSVTVPIWKIQRIGETAREGW